MTLYHRFDVLAQRGIGLVAYQVIVRLPNGGAQQPIFGDISGTPIVSTSGIANAAVTDEEGNFSYFVTPGAVFDEEYYSPTGVFVGATRNIPLLVGVPGPPGTPGQGLPDLEGPTGSTLVGYGTRTVSSALGDLGSLLNRGVTGDGITDDGPALAAAGSGALPSGTYRIKTNTVVPGDLLLLSGAVFLRDEGVTLTLNGQITAPLEAIFTGEGSVVVNAVKNPIGYAEWFGARPDIDGFDSFAAITATLATFHEWRGLPGSYFVSDTVKVARNGLRLTASYGYYDGTLQSSTRIVGKFNDRPVVRLGLDAYPATGGVNAMPLAMYMAGWNLQYNQAASTAHVNGVLDIAFARNSVVENNVVQGGMNGITAAGSVDIRVQFNRLACAGTPTGTGLSFYTGIYGNGNTQYYAGGNASLRVIGNTITGSTNVTTNTAVYFDAYFTDSFIEDNEINGVEYGVAIDGKTVATGPTDIAGNAADRLGNTDCRVNRNVVDGCRGNAIRIRNINKFGCIKLHDNYGAFATGVGGALVVFDGCAGRVIISKSTLLAWPGTNCYGFIIRNCASYCVTETNHVLEPDLGGAYIQGSNGTFESEVTAYTRTCAAVVVIDVPGGTSGGSNGGHYAPKTLGPENSGQMFTAGILCNGNANNYNEFNCTGLRSSMITGAKLSFNGHVISAPGQFNASGAADTAGLNTASGVLV